MKIGIGIGILLISLSILIYTICLVLNDSDEKLYKIPIGIVVSGLLLGIGLALILKLL